MKKYLFLSGVVFLAASGMPTIASAATNKAWSSTAMGCTPTHSTAEQQRYVTTGGKVKFKDGASGSISFVCPITETLRNGEYYVEGNFTNPSFMFGKGNSLQLRTMNTHTGAVSTVLNARTAIDGRGTKWGRVMSTSKLIGFENDRHVYWVQFSISRPTGEGESPSFSAVSVMKQ